MSLAIGKYMRLVYRIVDGSVVERRPDVVLTPGLRNEPRSIACAPWRFAYIRLSLKRNCACGFKQVATRRLKTQQTLVPLLGAL
jgi:hypothetical protein